MASAPPAFSFVGSQPRADPLDHFIAHLISSLRGRAGVIYKESIAKIIERRNGESVKLSAVRFHFLLLKPGASMTFTYVVKLDSPALDSIAASLKLVANTSVAGLSILMDVRGKVDQILAAQAANEAKEVMFEDDLIAKIQSQKTVEDGLVLLLNTVAGLVKSNPGPDAAKQAQALALLQGNTDEMTAAVVANTIAAPAPDPNAP
jgi:hypothetical protein